MRRLLSVAGRRSAGGFATPRRPPTLPALALLCLLLATLAAPLGAQTFTLRYADFDDAGSTNLGTLAEPWNSCTNLVTNIAAGDYVKIRRTASRNAENCTFTIAATNNDPIVIEGYNTTPGDASTHGDGGDAGFGNMFHTSGQWVVGNAFRLKFIDFTGQPSTTGGYLLDGINATDQWQLWYGRLDNTRTDAVVCTANLDDEGMLFHSRIVAPQNNCAVEIEDAGVVWGNTIDISRSGASGVLIEHSELRYQYVLFNIIRGTGTGKAIYSNVFTDAALGKNRLILNNSIYDVAIGIETEDVGTAGNDSLTLIANNMIWSADICIHNEGGANSAGAHIMHNAVGNCAGGVGDPDDYQGWGDMPTNFGAVALSEDPFEDASNWDFRIKATVTGPQCAGTFVDPNLDGTDINCLHIGAVQAIAPADERTLTGAALSGGGIGAP